MADLVDQVVKNVKVCFLFSHPDLVSKPTAFHLQSWQSQKLSAANYGDTVDIHSFINDR